MRRYQQTVIRTCRSNLTPLACNARRGQYLLGSRDMENLRDLLNFATDRGMLQRQLCVSE